MRLCRRDRLSVIIRVAPRRGGRNVSLLPLWDRPSLQAMAMIEIEVASRRKNAPGHSGESPLKTRGKAEESVPSATARKQAVRFCRQVYQSVFEVC